MDSLRRLMNSPFSATLISLLSCFLPPAVLVIFLASEGATHHIISRFMIEDVLTRYLNLPEHDRGGAVQNREYLIRTLKKLKSESDIALQLAKYASLSISFKFMLHFPDLQQEISRFQQQIQMAEEQLRIFEPDPLKISSMGEFESCEKNLMDTLTRVTQRKKYLLSNQQLSSYDPSGIQMYLDSQEGIQNSFGNEVVNWMPDNQHNPIQIYVGSDSLISLRDHSSTMYDQLQQGSNLNVDPRSMGECHVNQPSDGDLPTWHQAYTSNELLSALMPSTSFPLLQVSLIPGVNSGPTQLGP
ncbi:hypothetical protein BVC80_1815g55 [Macleaya cordata]|uniref:Uncharacterized protein n=1 Tax=Macleaya cordata TaxID=56857 RepID=A0A200QW06_MACCD|nr:hypothetical protein BVC80_1815g55 [Macleaya cordata]